MYFYVHVGMPPELPRGGGVRWPMGVGPPPNWAFGLPPTPEGEGPGDGGRRPPPPLAIGHRHHKGGEEEWEGKGKGRGGGARRWLSTVDALAACLTFDDLLWGRAGPHQIHGVRP